MYNIRYNILLILICITINFLEVCSHTSISSVTHFDIDLNKFIFPKEKNQNFTKCSYITFL